LEYKSVVSGVFLSRPNRFIANVLVGGEEKVAHVKNTGRCGELLIPGAKVFLSVSDNRDRKTALDLIAVEKVTDNGKILINIDSSAPNAVAEEWLCDGAVFGKGAKIKREVTNGDSRFDFYIEKDESCAYLEVKGATLEDGGIVMFPDAPTERGVKHVEGLTRLCREGFGAYVLFVVQMNGVKYFTPNSKTHPEFAAALKKAKEAGVNILAIDTRVTENGIYYGNSVSIKL
jgi:sugar fermentation stimulation protein A